jgi:hypothetical protein
MLLLSSATKILGTERPPGDAATVPHTIAQLYWSIRSKTRQREVEACVSEGEYRIFNSHVRANKQKGGPWPACPHLIDKGKGEKGHNPSCRKPSEVEARQARQNPA